MILTFEAAVLKCLAISLGRKEDVRGFLGAFIFLTERQADIWKGVAGIKTSIQMSGSDAAKSPACHETSQSRLGLVCQRSSQRGGQAAQGV